MQNYEFELKSLGFPGRGLAAGFTGPVTPTAHVGNHLCVGTAYEHDPYLHIWPYVLARERTFLT